VRVATWNLWWQFGAWRERRAAIGAELRRVRPDVCGLQEVWSDGTGDVAAALAAELGLHSAFAPSPAPERWQRRLGEEGAGVGVGNAVLSRWPIGAWEAIALPTAGAPDEGRLCVYAAIETPSGRLPFFSAHLSSAPGQSALRQAQVAAVADFLHARSGGGAAFPPVLTGDFNAPPDADEVRNLVGKTAAPLPVVLLDAWAYARPLEPGWTWARENPHVAATLEPDARIDYVFVGPPTGAARGHILHAERFGTEPVGGVWPSDHAGVSAVLQG
jgi:endonuclease/exonuclease/phosphatase family metal-dependent hydrolase